MSVKNIDFSRQLQAIRGLSASSFENSRDIKSCKVGSFLEIGSLTYRVDKINKYLEVKWKNFSKKSKDYWVYELTLFCLEDASVKFVEWEEDDEVVVYETIKSIQPHEVKYNSSKLSKSMLEYISDEEEGVVAYNGVDYHYSENQTWAALYYSDSGEPQQVRFYEFYDNSENNLTIEVWVDDDDIEREVFLSKKLPLSNINTLNL